jgi:hypothetical protein
MRKSCIHKTRGIGKTKKGKGAAAQIKRQRNNPKCPFIHKRASEEINSKK